MSLRGDNGGLQRNRWPDRAHGRRGTYDLRRNNPPRTRQLPLIHNASLSVWQRFTVNRRMRALCADHSASLVCNTTDGLRKRPQTCARECHRHSYGRRRMDGKG